jgi:parallel beta-helix repeat protein
MRLGRALAIAGTACVLLACGVPAAQAGNVIEVFPNPGALQAALNAATSGDTLLLHAGTYNEAVDVNTANVTVKAFGDGVAVVDAGCEASTTIDVNANGVRIERLTVRGGAYYEVDYQFVTGGVLLRSTLRDTCNALYGVNVYQNNGAMTIVGNRATGFSDAGIYVGSINTTGAAVILIVANYSHGNNRGVIVEETQPEAQIAVVRNRLVDNTLPGLSATTAGVFLHIASSVLIDRNTVLRNEDRGIELDPSSDGNMVTDNTVDGHTFDLANFGSSNCFSGNTYTTSTGSLPACP